MLVTIIIFIIMLTILVVVHELGHFWVARKVGIKVEEFGVGLPPKIWGKKRGETEWTINALPIGGFVRMYGETPDGVSIRDQEEEPEKDRMFLSKSKKARTAVLIAGVTANLALAVLIFTIVFSIGLPVYKAEILPTVDAVAADSPAAQAGIQPGDTIISLNGQSFEQLEPSFSEEIAEHKGEEVTIVYSHDGQTQEAQVTPRVDPPAGQGALGVTLESETVLDHVQKYPIWQAPIEGFRQAISFAGLIIAGLGSMIGQATQGTVPSDVAGPVGIASILDQAKGLGFIYVLWFAGIISVNLAVVNILPFPALDGGRLVFVVIEAITGRKVNQNIERWVHTAGMAFLLALIVLITFSDISRLLK